MLDCNIFDNSVMHHGSGVHARSHSVTTLSHQPDAFQSTETKTLNNLLYRGHGDLFLHFLICLVIYKPRVSILHQADSITPQQILYVLQSLLFSGDTIGILYYDILIYFTRLSIVCLLNPTTVVISNLKLDVTITGLLNQIINGRGITHLINVPY